MGNLARDPELWSALEEGARMRQILDDFYTRAFADPQLQPFFEGLTREWLVQKQYNFLKAKITGERSFFGNRPRRAHHWMVISDELFDHRESLMEACLRDAGLPEALIDRWLGIEEVFRKQIVKAAPVPLKINGIPLPLEGWEPLTTEIGSICDGCGEPVDAGITVKFHVRTGKMRCPACCSAESRSTDRSVSVSPIDAVAESHDQRIE